MKHIRNDTVDYVIVGAGSVGCVLANQLSADGRHRVLLLEAGGRDTSPWLHIPLGDGRVFADPKVDRGYTTEPDPTCAGRRIVQARGKVPGGSSSINGMICIRGNAADYDHWRQLGNAGWSYDDVLPYFRKAEDQARGADAFQGTGGPLAVAEPRDCHPFFMRGLDPRIHAGVAAQRPLWIAGSGPAMTIGGRVEPGCASTGSRPCASSTPRSCR